MALIDLWKDHRTEFAEKQIQQVIAIAGDGKLGDGSAASEQLREYLMVIPSDQIAAYAAHCLDESFTNSGFALQDIVNEIGRRLGFAVTHGRYRGTTGQPGNDGIWADGYGRSIVVEVKTTDAYRIDLNTIAGYRGVLDNGGVITAGLSSMLIVVGRQDTGGLEAQIRGSRHAWDMRLISVEALLRMLKLKEQVDDPATVKRIHEILRPREFTRLDTIVEIAFAAVEDVQSENTTEDDHDEQPSGKKFTPVAFHAQCIERIEKALANALTKQSRSSFSSADGATKVICSVSRFHERSKRYWFGFHPHQGTFLSDTPKAFVALGCGDAQKLLLIPYAEFKPWLEDFYRTERHDSFYWHVRIRESGRSFWLTGRAGAEDIEITKYLVK